MGHRIKYTRKGDIYCVTTVWFTDFTGSDNPTFSCTYTSEDAKVIVGKDEVEELLPRLKPNNRWNGPLVEEVPSG